MAGLIEASAVCMDIPILHASRRGLRRAFMETAKSRLTGRGAGRRTMLRALDDITFKLGTGDRVALFGSNGAGKTTLLQVVAGVHAPTSGAVRVAGRVSTLLALVDPDAEGTVVDNIRLAGILRGVRGSGLARLVDDVLDFSELEAYAGKPVGILSAGMRMRIGFGVATGIQCDVVLVDEIIGVGDAAFIRKAAARFREAARGISVLLLATHAIALAEDFCDRAFLLDRGVLVTQGSVGDVSTHYLELLSRPDHAGPGGRFIE